MQSRSAPGAARAVRFGRPAFHRRRGARSDAGDAARRRPPGIAPGRTTIRAWSRRAGRERLRAFRESFWGLLLIVIVLGGIYSRLFTPTEAAAVSAVYAFVIAVFVYKDMRLSDVPACCSPRPT